MLHNTRSAHLVDGPTAFGRFWVFGPDAPRGELFHTREDAAYYARCLDEGQTCDARVFLAEHGAHH